ncbi:MAG TPA: transposase [Bacteroidales bacterium]|nr:transposase [Bacteroidales bacterium]
MEKNDFFNIFKELGISKETILDISYETGLIKRKRIIDASDILFALCIESSNGVVSLNDIAAQIELSSGASVCKQAVWKKINDRCIVFFKKVLERIILNKISKDDYDNFKLSAQFNRILVQDSTIINLPVRLYEFYSGVSNQNTKSCNARIQGIYDILNEQFVSFSIDKYSKNDLAAAPELHLEKGDLSLRDRGYLINDEIQRHINVGADCIYRYKNKMCLLDAVTEKPIDLLDLLEKSQKLDLEIKLSNKDRTLVRLVAAPISEDIANIRRMKAKKEKKINFQRNI